MCFSTWQFVICVMVLALVIHKSPRHVKWIVSAGLAQVSEFAFVLGSRARRLDLISREVRLLNNITSLDYLLRGTSSQQHH